MPADLTASERPVLVRDGAGLGLPFSRGLMATSILATGADTDVAYAIAASIQRALAEDGARSIGADALAALAGNTIATIGGPTMAARYRTWRALRREGRPLVIVLGGAPGVGKSTLSTRLAVRLGITRVVTTDTIREVLRTVIPSTVLPELHVSTYEAISERADDPDAYLRQARVVGGALLAVGERLMSERRSVILEGVHLLPGEILPTLAAHPSQPVAVELLLTLDDVELHRAHLAARATGEPTRGGARALAQFARIRRLHEVLVDRARARGIETLDVGEPRRLSERLLELIFGQAAPTVARP
ncbi:MAG: AAA family ATPase [Kofleriaceae bacterium]